MAPPSDIDFADPDAVLQLVPGSGQRLVRLSFPDGTQFYSHPVALALGSGVLLNVLEDTQQQGKEQYTTIPLDDSADAAPAWQIALAVMHNQQADEVTMDNALGLLLLADKYEMPCITVPVREFLMFTEPGASCSRLAQQLKSETVVGWLTAASRCGLQQAVKVCIDFIVEQQMPVSFSDLINLNRADADLLLAAVHKRSADSAKMLAASNQKIVAGKKWLAGICAGGVWLKENIGMFKCADAGCGHTWAEVSKYSIGGSAQCNRCMKYGTRTGSCFKFTELDRMLSM